MTDTLASCGIEPRRTKRCARLARRGRRICRRRSMPKLSARLSPASATPMWCCWAKPPTAPANSIAPAPPSSRFLIRNHGFNIVAVEADWPDAARIDRYVRHRAPETIAPARPLPASPAGCGATWRFWNSSTGCARKTSIAPSRIAGRIPRPGYLQPVGLDRGGAGLSGPGGSGSGARMARHRYGCLTPWQDEPAAYGHHALMGGETCEREVQRAVAGCF